VTQIFDAHYADRAHQDRAGRLGMWLFVASEVLFFGALFALYAGYRAAHPEAFLAAAHHAKLVFGTLNTYVLLTSSLCVALAVTSLRLGWPRVTSLLIVVTMLLALVFLGFKSAEYLEHFREGILPGLDFHFPPANDHGTRIYFTLYYVMTGLHALHVVIGIGLFAWVLRRLRLGRDTPETHLGLETVGLYWHFVDIVWLFLWPTFYLIH
jgi:cytochrome c oxidase subunit 3